MKKIGLLLIVVFPLLSHAQYVPETASADKSESSNVDFGIGIGLDYGGIGGRLTVLPDKHFGLFGSVGYAIAGAGYNFGAKVKFNPDSRVCFATGAMYGYNAAIKVSGASQYDQVYYGASIFFGGEIRSQRNPKNYFNMELVIPFRSQEFTDDYNSLKGNSSISGLRDLPPVAFSFGYHFGF